MITLTAVSKIYDNGAIALDNVSLKVEQGTFMLLTGRSGSGKSTLLKLLYGAERPSCGEVWVAGKPVHTLKSRELAMLRRKMGIVFQDYKLIPQRTVAENVAMTLIAQGADPREIRRCVPPALKMVGLWHKEDCFPDQLSGGEQQRTAIARAIIHRPPLLLADEPTGNLDTESSLQVLKILHRLHSLGVTILMTSHDTLVIKDWQYPWIHLHNGRIQTQEAVGA
ncbi:MAG: cell division ATP-binding protein FtsE [Pseudanabaenaceae cyanobacterium]